MNKKEFISAIHRITNASLGNEKVSITATNKLLVLITAAGQIIGTPLQMRDELPESDSTDLEGYVAGAILSTASKLLAEDGESSFILLKDDVIAVTAANSYPD